MIFNESNIQVVDSVKNWEEAIRISAIPLLNNNEIEERYIDNIIESVNNLGFYIVIDDYVAMPHDRPENGAKENAISFLKINNGVYFGDSIIKLIFTLVAKDANSHIDLIKELLEILQDESIKEQLLQSTKIEQLKNILLGR